jgi:hypothetical protein
MQFSVTVAFISFLVEFGAENLLFFSLCHYWFEQVSAKQLGKNMG